jgi:hypothetical protein
MRLFVREKTSVLDEPIAKVLTGMNTYGPEDPEYKTMMEHLERLMKLKADEQKSGVSPDTLAIVLGNLLGILIIVAYEQKHVMVSRGLGFVIKARS